MHYRRFGRTELTMPVFTCGGMRFQHRWHDVRPDQIPRENQANLEAIVHRAFELGINHFETARGYGSSEMQLGWVLPRLPREKILVQAKVPPKPSAPAFRKTTEKSLKLLRLDYVDLLGLHGINNPTLLRWSLRKGGCLDVARQLQKEGRIRHVGFSTHGSVELILEAIRSGEFDYVNLHWYFVNDPLWPAVQEAHRHDMGVFLISPNDKGGQLYDPPPKLVTLCAPLTPMQFHDLYCLARPEVHTLSIGAARPTDFDEHVAALAHYGALAETLGPIEHRLRTEMNRVLGEEWCRRWPEGLPHYTEVPGHINVREILRFWTFAKSLDLVEWAKSRYNLLGQGDHWLPGENAARAQRFDLRVALCRSPFANRLPSVLAEAHRLLVGPPETRLSKSLRNALTTRLRRWYWRLRR